MDASIIVMAVGSLVNNVFGFLSKKQESDIASTQADAAYLTAIVKTKATQQNLLVGSITIIVIVTIIVVAVILKNRKK